MKKFIELFKSARDVSTPTVAVRTVDSTSTYESIVKMLDAAHKADKTYPDAKSTPLVSWDSIHGLTGKNDRGAEALAEMSKIMGIDLAASADPSIALNILEGAAEDVIAFYHNPQLVWENDKKVIQGIMNLRNCYKAGGNMLVLNITPGDVLPNELQNDVLMLEDEMPTAEELATIVREAYKFAADNPKYAACKKGPTQQVIDACVKALIGLPAFPAEQAANMELNKLTGEMDITGLWNRKRSIIGQMPGLSFHMGSEKLKDMAGNAAFTKFGIRLMSGKRGANLILRMDEIEKQFGGASTSEGDGNHKTDLLGEFLSWIEDNKIVCSLLLGVPGSSKSWSTYCIAGEYEIPCVNYSVSGMQDQFVGNSGKNLRNAQRVAEAMSGKKIWLIATANSLNGLPAELISRFSVGGIWFFDVPDDAEKKQIMDLKVAKYHLGKQEYPAMHDWTGRDIENCAIKAEALACSLKEASEFVLPLLRSHNEQMETLRMSAHDRYLSASKGGAYQYTVASKAPTKLPETINGRKMR
jgi:hypothetical protein